MDSFHGRVAVLTGGASGIGRALCEELGRRGAAVVIVADIDGDGAEQVVTGIVESGGRAKAVHVDVSREKDMRALIDDTVTGYGRIDYMFNNAGISICGEVRDLNLEHWQSIIGINLWGVIYGTISAYSVMVRQRFGHIVNTASMAGLAPLPMNLPYCATKHAVVGLSTSLRAEGEALGIKVSVVCPSVVRTDFYDASPMLNVDKEKVIDAFPFKMMDATKAAERIVRGVARNHAIIVFPLHARSLWWILRLHPSFLGPFFRKMVRDFRESRLEA